MSTTTSLKTKHHTTKIGAPQTRPQTLNKTAAQKIKHKTRKQNLKRAAALSSDTIAQRTKAANIAPSTDSNSRALALTPRLVSLLACHFSRSLSSMPKVSTCERNELQMSEANLFTHNHHHGKSSAKTNDGEVQKSRLWANRALYVRDTTEIQHTHCH